MERAVEVFVEHFQDYLDEATDRVILAGIPVYVNVPREDLRGAISRATTTVRSLQLAAPILPLHEGVLLIPLVGRINAERAAHVIQSLLASIMRQRSQAVIIDVTGMNATDESATDHLLHAAQAARLLGAKAILVGISPNVARTFTKAGTDLGGLTILGDLASGVEYALRLLGRAITRIR